MSFIEIIDLHKQYVAGKIRTNALNGITSTINRGDFLAITGKSGCGKTTLLNLIGGLDTPTRGKILVDGNNIFTQKDLSLYRRNHVAFVFQFFNLLPILSVEENIVLPLLLNKKKVDKKEISTVLSMLNLTEKRHSLPTHLSGGEQQRVAVGRALLAKPDILLADEPTGNLDSANSNIIVNMLRKLNKEYHQTIIMVTHDETIAKSCPRRIHICDGKIIEAVNEVNS